MRTIAWYFLWLTFLLPSALTVRAGDDDVGIAIVYDTSGSMMTGVKDASGKDAPKYQIANRALDAIVTRLEKFAASSPKKLHVGLYSFTSNGAKPVVPIAPFDPQKLRAWVRNFKKPEGGTPLGNATAEAARGLLAAKLGSRHVLVVTDGENTIGPPPEQMITKVSAEAINAGNTIYFHFVAFDVNSAVFAPVKRVGATLVSASDEKQLNEKLAFVIEEKILLEKE